MGCTACAVLIALAVTGCAPVYVGPDQEVPAESAEDNNTVSDDDTSAVVTDNVIDTDLFEITIPDEFSGVFEAEISERTKESQRVDIYHAESRKEGFAGLIFSVWARKVPSEFSGGPYVKVGELVSADGTYYDVVKGYASEIQTDYNKEVPGDYVRMYDAADSIIEGIKGIDGSTFMYGAGKAGEDLYGYTLATLIEALSDGADASKLEEMGFSPEFYSLSEEGTDFDRIGYAYHDVNVDGIDELLIGDIENGNIYSIYTMIDREPSMAVCGSARDRYYAFDDCFILNEYSGGADEYGFKVYILSENSTDMTLQWEVKYDGYTDEKAPWFKAYSDEEWEPITEKEYDEEIERAKHTELDLKPLSGLVPIDYSKEDLSKYATFTELVNDLRPGMGYANVTLDGTDVLLVSEGCFNNEGVNAAIDSSIFMYDENGAVVYLGKVSAGGTAYPLAVSDGKLYVASHHDICKKTVTDKKLVVAEEAFEDFYRDGSVTYYYGADDGYYKVDDDSLLTSMFEELEKAEVIEFSAVV